MAKRLDITGLNDTVKIGKGGPTISNNSGVFEVANDGESAVPVTTEVSLSPALSTGILGQVTMAIDVDPTKFDLTIEDGIFVNHTLGGESITHMGPLNFDAQTPAYLLTDPVTYIGINIGGVLQYKNSPFSPAERRTIVPLGLTRHINQTTIDGVNPGPVMAQSSPATVVDFILGLGAFNISGNNIAGNASDLTIKREAGTSFQYSGNHAIDLDDANFIITSEDAGASFFANYRDAGSGSTITVETTLDPDNWDDGTGTLNALAAGRAVAHRYWLFPAAGSIIIEYGQAEYANMAAARTGYSTELWEERNDLDAGIFMGWILLTEGILDFTAALISGDAVCVTANKFQRPS